MVSLQSKSALFLLRMVISLSGIIILTLSLQKTIGMDWSVRPGSPGQESQEEKPTDMEEGKEEDEAPMVLQDETPQIAGSSGTLGDGQFSIGTTPAPLLRKRMQLGYRAPSSTTFEGYASNRKNQGGESEHPRNFGAESQGEEKPTKMEEGENEPQSSRKRLYKELKRKTTRNLPLDYGVPSSPSEIHASSRKNQGGESQYPRKRRNLRENDSALESSPQAENTKEALNQIGPIVEFSSQTRDINNARIESKRSHTKDKPNMRPSTPFSSQTDSIGDVTEEISRVVKFLLQPSNIKEARGQLKIIKSKISNIRNYDKLNDIYKKLQGELEHFSQGSYSSPIIDQWSHQSFPEALLAYLFFPQELEDLYELPSALFERDHIRYKLQFSAQSQNPLALYYLSGLFRYYSEYFKNDEIQEDAVTNNNTSSANLRALFTHVSFELLKKAEMFLENKNKTPPLYAIGMLAQGLGDTEKAESYIKSAADKGDPRAIYEVANMSDFQGNQADRLKHFYHAIDLGYTKALLGIAFYSKTKAGAFENYVKAGENGVPEGYYQAWNMIHRGNISQGGRGDPLDYLIKASKMGMLTAYDTAAELMKQRGFFKKALKLYNEKDKAGDWTGIRDALILSFKITNNPEEKHKFLLELEELYKKQIEKVAATAKQFLLPQSMKLK